MLANEITLARSAIVLFLAVWDWFLVVGSERKTVIVFNVTFTGSYQ